jgi:hypothetical protein
MNCIDPSVIDEDDPMSVDPTLDPLSPTNGFRGAKGTRYSPEFVERYRNAQQQRVLRIDQHARALIDKRLSARKRVKERGDATLEDRRVAAHTPIINVWRTDADLRCFDLSLDPSKRQFGSLWGSEPYASNYGAVGFARQCTPESWLSTWSAASSNASLAKTASSITQPAIVVEYSGDQAAFPSDVKQIYDSIASTTKHYTRADGDHHGRPLTPGTESGRAAAARELVRWLHQHFPR